MPTVLGAIALQGIRPVNPPLGETVVVTGLGLIGLITVQLLRAHGCRVLGLDYDPEKIIEPEAVIKTRALPPGERGVLKT